MNPLILRGIRERLRGKHLIAAGLFSLIVTSTVYFRAYLDEAGGGWQGEPSPVRGARYAFPFLLALQGFYLMFLGTGRVASITAEEKESGLMDYQRMTPMNPFFKILGYLFGLPAREYYMFALTLPFLLHCMIVGELSIDNVLHLYFVFFSSVILYHLTAHVIGLVVPKPRAASWVSRVVVLGLYIFLPLFGQAGISFLSFLTILPTYFGKMLPELISLDNGGYRRWENDMIDFWQDVPFFATEISPSLFTLIMQGLILAALLITAYRKWRNESLPAFSKTSGIIIFAVFQFLLLGCLWPFFSEGQASGLLGETFSLENNSMKGGGGIFALLFVQSVFFGLSLLGILTLVNTCCPNQHLHLKGTQRANRLGLSSIPLSADESRGTWFVLVLSAMVCAVHAILLDQAEESGLFFAQAIIDGLTVSLRIGYWAYLLPAILVTACALYLQAARELWFSLGFWGFVGLLWITPLLACLVIAVGTDYEQVEALGILSAICPIFAIPQILVSLYATGLPVEMTEVFRQATWSGIGVSCFLAGFLSFKLYRKP
jgi:hypothetical protein